MLVVLAEDPGSSLSTHRATHSLCDFSPRASSALFFRSQVCGADIHAWKTLVQVDEIKQTILETR